MAETKKFKLSGLKLDEISFVDQPANALAKVVLFKAATKCKLGKSYATCPFVKGGVCKGIDCPMENKTVEKNFSGVQFNIGFKKDGSMGVESVSFNTETWDHDTASNWLTARKMGSSQCKETDQTLRFQQESSTDFQKFRVMSVGSQIAKALEHDASLTALQEQVGNALRDKFQPKNPFPNDYLWIRDLFNDYAVFDQNGETFQAPYTIRVDENSREQVITLGEKTPVEVVYQPISATSKKDNQIPAELLFKLGQMKAKLAQTNRRLDVLASRR